MASAPQRIPAMTHVTAYVTVASTVSPPFFHNSDHLPAMSPDNVSEVGPSSPGRVPESPLTVPSTRSPTPEPLNRMPEPNFWIELRHATAEERNYGDIHLNLREIVAEHTEGSKEFYYVLLGDDKHHKVCSSDA